MKRLFACFLLLLLLLTSFWMEAHATFYGTLPTGYQWVTKKGSGYGVYVPASFDPSRRTTLVFAFGRSSTDRQLTRKELKGYAELWAGEAEKRVCVVVIPYWEPVVVGSHKHTQEFYLEVLDETKLTYGVDPKKILLVGYGLGAVEAFSLALFYPDRFSGVATVSGSPLRDPVMRALNSGQLSGDAPLREFPPLLLVDAENGGSGAGSFLREDEAFLKEKGARVELKGVSDHPSTIHSVILDWFDTLTGV